MYGLFFVSIAPGSILQNRFCSQCTHTFFVSTGRFNFVESVVTLTYLLLGITEVTWNVEKDGGIGVRLFVSHVYYIYPCFFARDWEGRSD